MKINPSFLFIAHKRTAGWLSSALLANYDSGEFHIRKVGERGKGMVGAGKGVALKRKSRQTTATARVQGGPANEVMAQWQSEKAVH